MKNLKLITTITAFFFLLFTRCEEEIDSPAYNPNPDLAEVEPTPCGGNPPLILWSYQQFKSWGKEATLIIADADINITQLALLHSLYYDNSSANQSFGSNGEYTDQINKTGCNSGFR